MLISSIVLIVVRLISLQWMVIGLSTCAFSIGDLMERSNGGRAFLLQPSLLTIAFGVIGWIGAPYCSHLFLGGKDAQLSATSLSVRDLYAFSFVFLGLYFALSSLGELLTTFHQWLSLSSGLPFEIHRRDASYALVRPLVTFVAGLTCLFSASDWAERLSRSRPER